MVLVIEVIYLSWRAGWIKNGIEFFIPSPVWTELNVYSGLKLPVEEYTGFSF